MSRRAAAALAAAFVVALALPVQELGCTQTSQLALTRALAAGAAQIDRWQQTTCDKAWFGGHFYAVKAPGLAVAALPAYELLSVTHLVPAHATTLVWLLDLVTVVPAFLLLLGLVAWAAEWAAPGSGVLASTTLGIASLAFPFGTLWFGHVPAAALAFGAFVLLLRGRRHSLGVAPVAVAGLVAGTAVLFEYPVALIAVALAVYAGATRGLRGGVAFLAGAVVPAAGLLAYNDWAFGSIAHFSYEHAVIVEGRSGHAVVGANDQGFFGITWPSPHALAELLVSPRGLLTLTPVCLLGVAGVFALRRRARAESILAGTLLLVFLLYDSGYTLSFGGPFGGDSPGPRFLVAVLPFVLFPLGLAARARPGVAAALAAASAGAMILATATVPMVGEGETYRWIDALRNGTFAHTVVTLLGGGSGWAAIAPFLALMVGASALVVSGLVPETTLRRRTAFEAASALVAWLLLLLVGSRVFERGRLATGLVGLLLAVIAGAAALLWGRSETEPHLPAARH